MKQWIVGLLSVVSVACLTTGGGGPSPAPTPPVQAVAVIVHDFIRPTVPIDGVEVVCNETARGLTNADGFLETTAATGEHFECTLRKAGYLDTIAAFRPRPPAAGCDDCQYLRASLTAIAPPPPVSPGAAVGRLRLTAQGYADDAGPVLPLYAHAGNLFAVYVRDAPRALAELDAVAAAGYRGVRVWAQLGCGPATSPEGCPPGAYWRAWWVGPDVTPGYWDQLRAFLQALHARGLRAVLSQGDLTQLRDRCGFMRQLAAVDAELGGALDFIDAANEGSQTGARDPRRLAAVVQCYADAGGQAIRSLTSGDSEGRDDVDPYLIPPAQVWDIHSWRAGHWYDKVRHIFSAGYEGGFALPFGIQSEPPGNGARVSAIDNRHELDEEAVPLLAVASFLGRAAFVWFSGEGVILDRGLATEAGFASTPRAVGWLPRDLLAYPQVFHSGDRWRGTRILAAVDELRIDCRAGGPEGRFACLLYGPSGTYRPAVERGFVGRLCDPGTGACDDVAPRAGQSLPVTFTRGRVLVGRLQ